MTDHDSTNGGRRHQLNTLSAIDFGNSSSKCLRLLGKLKHKRALQIDRTMQTTRKLEVTFEQRSGLSELIDHLFRIQFLPRCQTLMLQSRRMPPYPNLVSDSTLVQDTIDLLTGSGGRAAASEIVDAVFKLSHVDDELAGLLVADLIRNDRRFKIINNTVELLIDDSHSRRLKDLDFVVVDVEATGAKTPPNRLIELGAYRIRGGRIVDKFLSLVNPEIPIPRFVASLTGISNEMVKRAPVFADLAPQWLDFVGESVLVAHNAPFDTSFLNHEISREM